MFKHSPDGKSMVHGPGEYNPNGKGIAPMEYTLRVYSTNGQAMVLRKIAFQSVNGHSKK